MKANDNDFVKIQNQIKAFYKNDNLAKKKHIERLESQLDQLHQKVESTIDERVAGNIPESTWQVLSQKWKDEEADITNRLNELNSEPVPFYEDVDRLRLLLDMAPKLYEVQSDEEKRRLLMVMLNPGSTLLDNNINFNLPEFYSELCFR